ncbi:sensor histidine kinase [uncultured Lutibacter sp.]|uniref:sensor histidine kinase n=1 Tax=uncultured Lutibacter sp. TaxID=437739 RepID=UPI00260808E2|nr:sensor histidine kinase [uncultured Lutibacter sp.]
MSRIVPFIVTYFLFQTILFAQIPGFTQFNSNNGLPSNTIYDINQDENGFIWLATDYGLSRFDGLSFKNYTIADGLPDNEILYFFKDSKQRIWLIGFNGKLGYLQNNKFYNSENQKFLKDLIFNNFVFDIFEDSKNNIWFLQSIKNIKKLDTSNVITNYNSLKHPPKHNFKKNTRIVENIQGEIKIISSLRKPNNTKIIQSCSLTDSVWKHLNLSSYNQKIIKNLKKNNNEDFKIIDTISQRISKTIFTQFNYDYNSNLLYQTLPFNDSFLITNLSEGALILNSNDNSKNKKILPSIHTTKSYLDKEKNIWIGSQSNGVYLFPNLHINGIQFEDEKNNDIHALCLFQNKIVVGNEQSEFTLIDINNLQIKSTYKIDDNPKRIRQLKVKDNSLYILSDFNIHKLDTSLKIERIKNMYDSDFTNVGLQNFKDIYIEKDVIITANAGGVGETNKDSKYTKKLWNKRSTAISHDKNGNIWIGTTKGLYYYNKTITKKYDLGEPFNNSTIYALENSSKGLLIGSNSYGLGILKNKVFKTFSTEDGLLSNYIKSIFIDTKKNIWISTNFGLNCLELNNANELIKIKSYTTSDGLYSNDVRASYVYENNVYVATAKGLNIIDISNETVSILSPNALINEILINNTSIDKNNGQVFNYKLNNFQFNFSGISFKSLGNISFKYRLSGLEEDWITTKTNTIRYSSLQPNNYTFELIAISKNKLESDKITFSFTIKPPIYKTWWFRSLIILAILALIFFIFHLRNLKLKRLQNTKDQISNLKYQALNAQMNPHFINNLLVNINSLVDKGEIKEVKGSLDKFAELVNLILNSTKSNLISLTDEIEMAKLYLELQKLRFNKHISYSINTEAISQDLLEAILVPPMILQPIIENSFKHGFKNGNNSNTITVNFKIENDEFLYCEISDNGKGIQNNENSLKSKGSGISFSNINERLQLINESDSTEKLVLISNITDEFNTLVGLKVTLKIPLINF